MAKQLLALVACLSMLAVPARSQSRPEAKPYKVVFDLTSPDPLDQQAVLRWLREIASLTPRTDMEVVMYGRGLQLVIPGKNPAIADVQEAMSNPHVSFKVCAMAMKNQKVEKSDLLPNVQVVPDGISEIVARQNRGWGYIKVGH